MSAIRILHEKVISQIAAGEVIERPASVVRELLDNSVDAGAARIDIRLERGGKRLIRVVDDGVGMNRDDLLLSVERHATSKILSLEDLFTVKTLGFRGEALPSIGSVSRMEVTSRPHDQLVGHRLKVVGGSVQSIAEAGCPVGTSVEVRDLFFNTPVRKRSLKGERTETDHIVDVITRIGLPHLQVHIRLDEGERSLLNLPQARDEPGRFLAVFGRTVAASMAEAHHEEEGFRLRAYLGEADFARARADRVLFYVNERNVRDRLLLHAVMEGYGQRLMKGRYPQAVVFIETDPALVDVNIHPAKQEVRFQDAHKIHQILVAVIQGRLGRPSMGGAGADFQEAGEWTASGGEESFAERGISEVIGEYLAKEEKSPVPETKGVQEPLFPPLSGRVVGQLRNTYILCEGRDGLILIDQHAAHERVVYESLRRSYQESRVESQAFLIPHRLELSIKDAGVLAGGLETLRNLGLEIEPFGGCTFLLRSVPLALVGSSWEEMFAELMPALAEGGPLSRERVLDRFLTVLACHGALRAGHRMSHEEMILLVDQLRGTGLPAHCPHGRPTMRTIGYGELERMFRRVL